VLLNPGVLCLDRPFEIVADISGGRAGHPLDALAIPVVNEISGRPAAHCCQAVLGVVGQAVGAAHDALGHIAVAIIGVAVPPGRRNGVRDGAVPPGAGDLGVVGVAHPGFAGQVAGRPVVVIVFQRIRAARSAAGDRAGQPFQVIIGEGLRLRAARLIVADGQHVSNSIVGVAQVLQRIGSSIDAALDLLQASTLVAGDVSPLGGEHPAAGDVLVLLGHATTHIISIDCRTESKDFPYSSPS